MRVVVKRFNCLWACSYLERTCNTFNILPERKYSEWWNALWACCGPSRGKPGLFQGPGSYWPVGAGWSLLKLVGPSWSWLPLSCAHWLLLPSGSYRWLGECLWLAGDNGLTEPAERTNSPFCHGAGTPATSPTWGPQRSQQEAREGEMPPQSLEQDPGMRGLHPWFQWLPSASP